MIKFLFTNYLYLNLRIKGYSYVTVTPGIFISTKLKNTTKLINTLKVHNKLKKKKWTKDWKKKKRKKLLIKYHLNKKEKKSQILIILLLRFINLYMYKIKFKKYIILIYGISKYSHLFYKIFNNYSFNGENFFMPKFILFKELLYRKKLLQNNWRRIKKKYIKRFLN